jgi:hypothetical protein
LGADVLGLAESSEVEEVFFAPAFGRVLLSPFVVDADKSYVISFDSRVFFLKFAKVFVLFRVGLRDSCPDIL